MSAQFPNSFLCSVFRNISGENKCSQNSVQNFIEINF